jgi:hypothetical protein
MVQGNLIPQELADLIDNTSNLIFIQDTTDLTYKFYNWYLLYNDSDTL